MHRITNYITSKVTSYNKMWLVTFIVFFTLNAKAENGHDLWLKANKNIELKSQKAINLKNIKFSGKRTSTIEIVQNELATQLNMPVKKINLCVYSNNTLGNEGFEISYKNNIITITSPSDKGLMYGAYALIRKSRIGETPKEGTVITEKPKNALRLLNHWDNLNGNVERGYAGKSIFWGEKNTPLKNIKSEDGKTSVYDKRILDYARANASVGINGMVINNVNASPKMMSDSVLAQVAHVANLLRPYGIKTYISVNFASPKALGEASTADPLEPEVQEWWKNKAKQIYKLIPDFGGFLVKANSEGEPGPMDYGRTHVDGANMLADALAPYGGIIMWRAFVYAANSSDRACQAYEEFMPLDGKFRDNVILQVKNGPIDFQPREPVSPLFFNIKSTRMMPEFQITQEYLGESIHSVYLGTMWKEFFQVLNDNQNGQKEMKAIAGVSNVGDDINWCGSDMAQANWYTFGRMAWDENLSCEKIAQEWLKLTFSSDERFVTPMTELMMASHEAAVSYMMPLGLHHIFAGGHHYGPEPWYAPKGVRKDWTPPYYHKADSIGIGFDRTKNGSNNVSQYPEALCNKFNDIKTCPDKYILWFHHVPWNAIWNKLCYKYDEGVSEAERFATIWKNMKPYVDDERYQQQLKRLERQATDAWWWRDACLLYFQQFSKMPLPANSPATRFTLKDVMKYNLPMDIYTTADMDKLPVPKTDEKNNAMPYVYNVENTGENFLAPKLVKNNELTKEIKTLPDPFVFEDGSRNTDISNWEHHRNDIKSYLEYYEIGQKPSMKDMTLKAKLEGTKLTVTVTNPQGTSIDLTATITWPGKSDIDAKKDNQTSNKSTIGNDRASQLKIYGSETKSESPVPALIGISCTLPVNLFLSKGCALINFDFNTVCKHQQTRGEEPINKLYPELKANGAYSYWSWGISRIIDGLQQLGPEVTGIDTRRLAVSGCSWAGKAALWSGALDERICLVIPQEPGGGGVAAWRVSETLGNVETIGRTDGHWFLESMIKDFGNGNVSKLPIDHHQLVAMVAPRAILMFGNTDYEWLADESAYVSMQAAKKIYKTLGIPDRIGFAINGKHMHCLLPENEYQYLTAYIDRFLLGKDVPTDFEIAPSFESVDYMKWIQW